MGATVRTGVTEPPCAGSLLVVNPDRIWLKRAMPSKSTHVRLTMFLQVSACFREETQHSAECLLNVKGSQTKDPSTLAGLKPSQTARSHCTLPIACCPAGTARRARLASGSLGRSDEGPGDAGANVVER